MLIFHNGREDRIWTCNLSVPNRMLYQVEPLPDFMVRPRGVEPLTFWSVVKCSIQLSYERRLTLKIKMVASVGIEPTTPRFSVLCSANWAMKPNKMAVRTGLEPVISRVTGERDNHYTNEPWLREPDLNQQPLGYEPSELPDCSIPRYYIRWRRKRDSNPCADFSTSRFSRPVPSTRLGYSSRLVPKVGLEPTRGFILAGF